MVSFWPWKGEDTSPASFEKALSALTAKITQSQAHLDSLRSNSRRFKALWTLYSSFAYLLCFIILFLVVGWPNWTVVEYTALSGSPVIIYVVRTAISTYYSYRIDNAVHRLEDQQTARTKTIEKLKAATKYNSTQELLEKYGGAPPKSKKDNSKESKPPVKNQKSSLPHTPGRVGTGPPPATANIQRQVPVPSQPSTPQPLPQPHISNRSPSNISPSSLQRQILPDSGGFAPNAFSSPQEYAQSTDSAVGGHWYDRVLDLLMGEDETSPKNRIALICQACRLVNGQAPPGTKSPSDLGKWRCFSCGAWNGEEDEAVKAVQEMKEKIETESVTNSTPTVDVKNEASNDEMGLADETGAEVEEEESDESTEEIIEVKPKRGRPKGSKKKA